MRKKILIFILFIVVFLNIKVVDAVTCDELKLTAESNFDGDTGIDIDFGGRPREYSLYTLKDNYGSTFSAYCRNAGWSSGWSYAGQTFHCDHKVFDANSTNETTKTYDAGIIAILTNGYSVNNPNYNATSTESGNNVGYAATNVALRVYEMLTSGEYKTNNATLNLPNMHYAKLWLNEYSSDIKEIFGNPTVDLTNAMAVNMWKDSNGNDITAEVEAEAKRLFKIGLDAAKEYKEKGAATLTGLNDKPKEKRFATEEDSNGVKTYKKEVEYTFVAKGFNSSNSKIFVEFACEDCETYNVDYKITVSIDGNEIGNVSNETNLVNYLNNGAGTISYKIEFSATSDNYNCEMIDYDLQVNYFEDSISTEAFDVYSDGCSSNTSCQHFYLLYTESDIIEHPIDDKYTLVELCTLTCKEAEEECLNNGNENACKVYNETYGGDCAECTTYINNAECTVEDSEIDILEGYDVDTSNCGNITEDNLNVLQCIINNSDPSGNRYEATTSGNGDYAKVQKNNTNRYCGVYCKEEYHLTLPGQKETNSGRYFSLQASVEGAKTCYTSKIDLEKFKKEAEEARKAVIDAYNEYAKWKAAAAKAYDTDSGSDYAPGGCCTSCCGSSSNCSPSYCSGGDTTSWRWYEKEWYYTVYDYGSGSHYVGGQSSTTVNEKSYNGYYYDGGVTSCGCCSCQPDNIGEEDSPSHEERKQTAKNTLDEAIAYYADLINQYDSCYGEETYEYDKATLDEKDTSGWIMDYEFEPIFKFWYEESYMNNVLTDELDTIGTPSVSGINEKHFEQDNGKIPTNEINGEKFYDISSVLESGSNFVCYASGDDYTCGPKEINVGKAKYVSQEMESSGEYITPTQFYNVYPTGAIVVAPPGMEDEIPNSTELTNLLPVGLGTTQGVYNYALMVDDLGEYYNKKDVLGRLWGDSDSVVVTVLEDENTCIKPGGLTSSADINGTMLDAGIYVCAYTVNCPDCPVECDPVCENPDCPDNNCPVECDNCVYTNGKTNVSYRPITPSDINPNDRELGKNWYTGSTGGTSGGSTGGTSTSTPINISTAMQLKAYITTQEIEESGESIYDVDYDNPTQNVDTDFAIKVSLDTRMINKIKEYNDRYENSEGYANNSLKCYDHTGSDGETYDNIYCYSTFIDELFYDGFEDNITIVGGERIIGLNEDDSDSLRKSQTQNSGYWTPWDAATWNITTQTGINYQSNYKNIGIGPSWK